MYTYRYVPQCLHIRYRSWIISDPVIVDLALLLLSAPGTYQKCLRQPHMLQKTAVTSRHWQSSYCTMLHVCVLRRSSGHKNTLVVHLFFDLPTIDILVYKYKRNTWREAPHYCCAALPALCLYLLFVSMRWQGTQMVSLELCVPVNSFCLCFPFLLWVLAYHFDQT